MTVSARAIFLVCIMLCGYVVWKGYQYVFDTSFPVVCISGIESDGYYAGDVRCVISMSDDYKVADVSIFLDNSPLVSHFKINRAQDEHLFSIPTTTLSNGKHELKVQVRDGSYQKNTTVEVISFYIDNRPLQAAFVTSETEFKVFQGRTLHIQFQVNKQIKEAIVKLFSQTYVCVPESENSCIYECFIPVSCEEVPNEYIVAVETVDHVGNSVTLDAKLQVILFPFKKQHLTINPEYIKKADEIGLAEQALEQKLLDCLPHSPKKKLWQGSFCNPIDSKQISTEFGTIRTTQHRGRYAHNAVDLIGPPKTVVWSIQDGVVIIKERYVHSGNTVVIDHGCGIFSLFYHLDNFAKIAVGDKIKKGNPVGTLGNTGHVTGYHLHLEMRINNVAVDPMQWTRNDF